MILFDVCRDFDDAYIGFEVVSNGSYLREVPGGEKTDKRCKLYFRRCHDDRDIKRR